MAITLGAITLPAGLRWIDELDWSPTVQSIDYTVVGALIVQEGVRLAGRPITLVGGIDFIRITRANLLTLAAALDAAAAGITLTLHDARTFSVLPRRDESAGPLSAHPVPIVLDSGPANPATTTLYYIEAIRLIAI